MKSKSSKKLAENLNKVRKNQPKMTEKEMKDQINDHLKIGTIHDSKSMFLREGVGSCKDQDGNEYELNNGTSLSPLVRNLKTGKWFSLSWEDVVNLAKDNGIDEK